VGTKGGGTTAQPIGRGSKGQCGEHCSAGVGAWPRLPAHEQKKGSERRWLKPAPKKQGGGAPHR
jgi:hypothetical protein